MSDNDVLATILAAIQSSKEELKSVKNEINQNINEKFNVVNEKISKSNQIWQKAPIEETDQKISDLELNLSEIEGIEADNEPTSENNSNRNVDLSEGLNQSSNSENVTVVQSSASEEEKPLERKDTESAMETKQGDDLKKVKWSENNVDHDNEHLSVSPANEMKKRTDDRKDCGDIVVPKGSMAEMINESESSRFEKEKTLTEEKETLNEDESSSDNAKFDLPEVDKTDGIVCETEKGEIVTDMITNDGPSKPKDYVRDINYSREIEANDVLKRIKQKLGVIDPG